MTARETLLLAALIVTILFHLFATDLALRTDWINFGSEYRANQGFFANRIGDISSRLERVERQTESVEKEKKNEK
jgi:hypothetical protein